MLLKVRFYPNFGIDLLINLINSLPLPIEVLFYYEFFIVILTSILKIQLSIQISNCTCIRMYNDKLANPSEWHNYNPAIN